MYICIDFDGTIVDHTYPSIGQPVPQALEWMTKWFDAGAFLILFTMRSDKSLQEAVDYLTTNNVKLFGINNNPTQCTWTASPKAYAHVYVDDAAYGCPLVEIPTFNRRCVDWSVVGPDIHDRIINDL